MNSRDMRIQRAIEADARMREVVKKSKHWPDPDKPRGERMTLKPIHVGKDGQRIVVGKEPIEQSQASKGEAA